MGAGKWIGGILGFMTMGPLGALAGFAFVIVSGFRLSFFVCIAKKSVVSIQQ
jgi:hypothetical protein